MSDGVQAQEVQEGDAVPASEEQRAAEEQGAGAQTAPPDEEPRVPRILTPQERRAFKTRWLGVGAQRKEFYVSPEGEHYVRAGEGVPPDVIVDFSDLTRCKLPPLRLRRFNAEKWLRRLERKAKRLERRFG